MISLLNPDTCKVCRDLLRQYRVVGTMRKRETWDPEKLKRRVDLLDARAEAHLARSR